jgi:argininosuccinate lyase
MWSGRFREPLDAEFESWQRSIVFDWRLLDEEIAASKAHASALIAAFILTEDEGAKMRAALDAIAADHASEAGKAQVRDHASAEDIHHFVELSASAHSVSSCTPAAAATSRLPPISASTCASRSASPCNR